MKIQNDYTTKATNRTPSDRVSIFMPKTEFMECVTRLKILERNAASGKNVSKEINEILNKLKKYKKTLVRDDRLLYKIVNDPE